MKNVRPARDEPTMMPIFVEVGLLSEAERREGVGEVKVVAGEVRVDGLEVGVALEVGVELKASELA